MWEMGAGDKAKDLRWIIGWSVMNSPTVRAIRRAYGSNDLARWPGKVFQADSDEGKALLGMSKISYSTVAPSNESSRVTSRHVRGMAVDSAQGNSRKQDDWKYTYLLV
jgi:hypothetical protein